MFKIKVDKVIALIISTTMVLTLLTNVVYASNNDSSNTFKKVEYSEEFKKWLELSDEEKSKVLMPKVYDDIITTNETKNNLLGRLKLFGLGANSSTSFESRFSLKDIIPENLKIKNQQQTHFCWAFAGISSLETNLALNDYKNNIATPKVYDYSERHVVYSNIKTFKDGTINENGYNIEPQNGGTWWFVNSYLTNGLGAITEEEMPFENNEDTINISEIQNKDVSTQVYDTTYIPAYYSLTGTERTAVMNQIKNHIKNYGSVFADLHGNDDVTNSNESCYNNETGAKYCKDSTHKADHAISIIGWDDNYSVDNFNEGSKPSSNGAWIVRNSWGENYEIDKAKLKDVVFEYNKDKFVSMGINSGSEIPDTLLEDAGYTIDGDKAYLKYGDNGIIYVSYEDYNIASNGMFGVEKASDNVKYKNIYQYDKLFPMQDVTLSSSSILLSNIFDKKTSEKEYLNQVSLFAPETYKCKVYINPNGTSTSKDDLQLVQLETGESETIGAGYHSLEFAKPIEITGDKFAVVVAIEGTRNNVNVMLESKMKDISYFDTVKVESGKCFLAFSNNLDKAEWHDLGNLSSSYPELQNGDSSIKAFTISEEEYIKKYGNTTQSKTDEKTTNNNTYTNEKTDSEKINISDSTKTTTTTQEDDTTLKGQLPFTGKKSIIIISILIITSAGVVIFKKYKILSKYVK